MKDAAYRLLSGFLYPTYSMLICWNSKSMLPLLMDNHKIVFNFPYDF